MVDGGEPRDVADLEIDGERQQAPDARNPEEALHRGRFEECGLNGNFQGVDLVGEHADERGLGGGLDLVEGRQVLDPRDIPFLEQAIEAILGTTPDG